MPLAATVTADSQTYTYGDNPSSVGDVVTTSYGESTLAGELSCSTTYTQGDGVLDTTETTNCTGADPNYDITFVAGTVTITATGQSINVPTSPSGPWSGSLSVATTATSKLRMKPSAKLLLPSTAPNHFSE